MYAILRAKKLKSRGQITQAAEHNLRLQNNNYARENIDLDRSNLNQILYNPLGIDGRSAPTFREKLDEHYSKLGIKEKKDNVLLLEFVATASPEFFKGKSIEQISAWASNQVKFMKNEFGNQVKLAILHLDEKTPHVHFFVSTECKSIKNYKNRYGNCQKETWSLNAKRYGPEYLSNLQTRFAEANRIYGLKRGVRGSERANVPLKQYYKLIDKWLKTDHKKKIQAEIDKFEVAFFGRFSMDDIRTAIKEHFLPILQRSEKLQSAITSIEKLDFHELRETLEKRKGDLDALAEDLDARKLIYREAINKFRVVDDLNRILIEENQDLSNELDSLKDKYGPSILQSVSDHLSIPI